jgi:uncharacterized peroxidase-related enzyme
MAFIETYDEPNINDDVRAMYARQAAHWGFVPNYAKVFCHRPHVMALWAQLQSGIRKHMDKRRFELVTFAAAHELRSTLCSLAHGKALAGFISESDVVAIARGDAPASLTPAEVAMVAFARAVARDASSIKQQDVEHLREHGFSDAEIFDIVATAAARSFWTKLIESLGVEAEPLFRSLDPPLIDALVCGRPIVPTTTVTNTMAALPLQAKATSG